MLHLSIRYRPHRAEVGARSGLKLVRAVVDPGVVKR
jgi:hypothetical protein